MPVGGVRGGALAAHDGCRENALMTYSTAQKSCAIVRGAHLAIFVSIVGLLAGGASSAKAAAPTPAPAIPIRFTLSEPGYVTLVIDDAKGVRVRNPHQRNAVPRRRARRRLGRPG